MTETRFQREDRQKRERIGIAMKRMEDVTNTKDLALWVTHDGMDLFQDMMKGMVKRVAGEVFVDVAKELFTEIAAQQLRQLAQEVVQETIQEVPPQVIEYELEPIITPTAIVYDFESIIEPEVEVRKPKAEERLRERKDEVKSKKASRKGKARSGGWSDEENEILTRCMTDCYTASIGFENASEKLPGRSIDAMRVQWYGKLRKQKQKVNEVIAEEQVEELDIV